ncbi:zinc finger MYM-type protein 1-like [Aphis craccivora]|uniref:Zinc finger MYM-type protein 1-like n=1 Tax=Aphis craccivora TaxID=307492 RepID=A0A6G0WMZ9_APHCR|nr:zinc finger MYM-type protein 1-like [Aphis craccivora]
MLFLGQHSLPFKVKLVCKFSPSLALGHNNFFSVSIDTTFDSSRREQLAFIIRYVCTNEHSPVIREQLLGLRETSKTTG